ncbi:hypothetical protein DSO57_1033493 [Entomophthora muscae]|uniref:Uncharacterized protein n=2 Tax=Entomophthora muscae TaxID=34485 RepID=A0ACC2TN81_9FUNG|nr:hypothetical protein DSO57_1033493 [Entomophthora muscae]
MLSLPDTNKSPSSSSDKIDESHSKVVKNSPKNLLPRKLSENEEESLTLEMINLTQTISLSPKDLENRQTIMDKIQNIFVKEYPDKEIKAYSFGSSNNGLGAYNSDVDVCLLTTWAEFDVKKLAIILQKYGFEIIDCISEAKVPIVKARELTSNISFDFNINNPLALDNTRLLKTYACLDPRVAPLVVCIKFWAKQRVLNDAAAGGTFSTYTWVNVILNFLQTRSPPILPALQFLDANPKSAEGLDVPFFDNHALFQTFGRANKETLGGLLFRFFKRFGYEFNYEEDVISLRSGKILNKAAKGWVNAPGNHFFCIEEPFNTDRNLGNSADRISVEGIRWEFRRAAQILSDTSRFAAACSPYYIEDDTLSYMHCQQFAESEIKALKKRLARESVTKAKPDQSTSDHEQAPLPLNTTQGSSTPKKDKTTNPKHANSRRPSPRVFKGRAKTHQLSDLLPLHKIRTRHCKIDKQEP